MSDHSDLVITTLTNSGIQQMLFSHEILQYCVGATVQYCTMKECLLVTSPYIEKYKCQNYTFVYWGPTMQCNGSCHWFTQIFLEFQLNSYMLKTSLTFEEFSNKLEFSIKCEVFFHLLHLLLPLAAPKWQCVSRSRISVSNTPQEVIMHATCAHQGSRPHFYRWTDGASETMSYL